MKRPDRINIDRHAFGRGLRDALPLLLGIVPFALVSGVAATKANLSFSQAMGLSVFVFAGTSQIAALSLVRSNAPFLVAVLTAVVVNLRIGMYSASIAPYFRKYETRWRALLSYFLVDQTFALSLAAYRDSDVDHRWYYLGVAVTLWTVWQAFTVVGIVVGAGVPTTWGLDFAVPLVLIALLVPMIEDVPKVGAAAVAAVVAVVGAGWPLNLGLLAGAAAGILTGLTVEVLTR